MSIPKGAKPIKTPEHFRTPDEVMETSEGLLRSAGWKIKKMTGIRVVKNTTPDAEKDDWIIAITFKGKKRKRR